MKTIHCLIIDDEPIARQGINDYCKEISFLNIVAVCKNAMQANAYLHTHQIDLLFLDINMPVITGLDWLKTLEKSPLVIMTTAYAEYALESFSYEVIDYLVKPISFERFLQAVNKSYRLINTNEQDPLLFIKTSNSIKKVNLNSILFIESMQNYVKIITVKETITTHSTLKQIKESLTENFIQTHKSYVVSKDKIDEITGNLIVIEGHKIPISVRLKKDVMEQILKQ